MVAVVVGVVVVVIVVAVNKVVSNNIQYGANIIN